MNFKNLLEQYSFEDIFPNFMKLWKINVPESAELLDNDGWKKIYYGIQSLNVKPSDYYILLVCRWERCSPMIDMNCSIYSKNRLSTCLPYVRISFMGRNYRYGNSH